MRRKYGKDMADLQSYYKSWVAERWGFVMQYRLHFCFRSENGKSR